MHVEHLGSHEFGGGRSAENVSQVSEMSVLPVRGMTKLPETCARSVLPVILWIAAFLSFNGVDLIKSVTEGMERLDGILGLHIDDFIGGGGGMSRVAVEGWNHVTVECRVLLPA